MKYLFAAALLAAVTFAEEPWVDPCTEDYNYAISTGGLDDGDWSRNEECWERQPEGAWDNHPCEGRSGGDWRDWVRCMDDAHEQAAIAEERREESEMPMFILGVVLQILLGVCILCCIFGPFLTAGCCLVKARNRKTEIEKSVYIARHRAEQKVSMLAQGKQPMMEEMITPHKPVTNPLYQESAGNQIAPK